MQRVLGTTTGAKTWSTSGRNWAPLDTPPGVAGHRTSHPEGRRCGAREPPSSRRTNAAACTVVRTAACWPARTAAPSVDRLQPGQDTLALGLEKRRQHHALA